MSDIAAVASPVAAAANPAYTLAAAYWQTYSAPIAAMAGAAVVATLGLLIDGFTSRVAIFTEHPWFKDRIVSLLHGGAIQAGKATESAIRNAGSKR
jgi:hypothetical protein